MAGSKKIVLKTQEFYIATIPGHIINTDCV